LRPSNCFRASRRISSQSRRVISVGPLL
jgi:hypothetical protein